MKILFASPERDLLASYGRLLTEEGFDVLTAFDGTQAVELLDSADLLIIDEKIPRVSSESIIKQAGERGTPVIVLTYRAGAADVGGVSYLPFPFAPQKLISLCEKRGERQKNLNGGDING